MDLVSTIRKEGSRGGVNFSWDDVSTSSHRENYLGHSLKAPVGRWQKGRDLSWYSKGDEAGAEDEEKRRKEEIRKIKEAEEDALARAMGLPVVDRNGGDGPAMGTGANNVGIASEVRKMVGEVGVEGEEKGRAFGEFVGKVGKQDVGEVLEGISGAKVGGLVGEGGENRQKKRAEGERRHRDRNVRKEERRDRERDSRRGEKSSRRDRDHQGRERSRSPNQPSRKRDYRDRSRERREYRDRSRERENRGRSRSPENRRRRDERGRSRSPGHRRRREDRDRSREPVRRRSRSGERAGRRDERRRRDRDTEY